MVITRADDFTTLLKKQAEIQPKPLKRNGVDGKDKYEEFFKAMADLWSLASKHNLTEQIEFTNFVIFGPQSAGKTTLTERILGFPVAIVTQGVGTTRPVVLTTRRLQEEKVKVKGYGAGQEFVEMDTRNVMAWATAQMKTTGFTEVGGNPRVPRIVKDPIYIEISGPKLMDRRFVDLPGYQTNDEGTRAAILDILIEEVNKPNTVVVCVEDSDLDYVNSHLMKAIHDDHVLGEDFDRLESQDKANQFVLVLNKSDKWLSRHETTADLFEAQLLSYRRKFGIMPILVGGSVDAQPNRDDFDIVVAQYEEADDREALVYGDFFHRQTFNNGTHSLLENRFMGFNTFLSTVDSIVVDRDIENFALIITQLSNVCNKISGEINESERKLKCLKGDGESSHQIKLQIRTFLHELLSNKLREIALADSGRTGAQVGNSIDLINRYGNTAFEEDMDFMFGRRSDTNPPDPETASFGSGYYSQDRKYQTDCEVIIRDDKTEQSWKHQAVKTLQELAPSAKLQPSTVSISYLNQRLVVGTVYERALAVWSSSVYQLLMPGDNDLDSLANTMGCDYEMKDPNTVNTKRAKRLAEIYIERLAPAIHFLCQKVEYLLLIMFDTAWEIMLKIEDYRIIVEAFGGDSLKKEVRSRYEETVRQNAETTFSKALSDLRNEVTKLFPYSTDHAAFSGMLHAFPDNARDTTEWRKSYNDDIGEMLKRKCEASLGNAPNLLFDGIKFGVDLIARNGSIDPLLLPGIALIVKHMDVEQSNQEQFDKNALEEVKNRWLLGVACSLYAHFLPRFISTIDGRLRDDLWASVKCSKSIEKIKTGVEESKILKDFEDKINVLEAQIKALELKRSDILEAKKSLEVICHRFPKTRRTKKIVHHRQSQHHSTQPVTARGGSLFVKEEEKKSSESKEEDGFAINNSGHTQKIVNNSSASPSISSQPSSVQAYQVDGARGHYNGIYVSKGGGLYTKYEDPSFVIQKKDLQWILGKKSTHSFISRYFCEVGFVDGRESPPSEGWKNTPDETKAENLRVVAC